MSNYLYYALLSSELPITADWSEITNMPFIDVKNYGATGDGVTDDTTALQAAIDACPVGGRVIGLGKTYVVSRLTLKSYMILQDFYFKSKASSTDDVSVINVGEYYDTAEYRDIIFINVHIDGNRQNHSSITIPQEDGKRHGFRFVGHIRNILLENCSASYCATDGLKLFCGQGTRGGEEETNTPLQFNVVIKDSQFNWNRRHGCSSDTNDGLIFDNCEFNDNGQDLNETDPLDHGNRGARYGGNLYGKGFTIEAYGVGSSFRNICLRNVTTLRNVQTGIFIYDQTDQATEGYTVHDNILVENCYSDAGTVPASAWGYTALLIDTNSGIETGGYIYSNVRILNNDLRGRVYLRCVQNGYLGGGCIVPEYPQYLGQIRYSANLAIGPFSNPYRTKFSIYATTYDFDFGEMGFSFRTAVPGSGTWRRGQIIWNTSPSAGAEPGWVCVTSGTFSSATDSTGDTDGSTGVITGMTDTSDFSVGEYVSVSAGFPTTGPYKIIAKTASSITINENSNSAQSNITVDTPNPVFKAMPDLEA